MDFFYIGYENIDYGGRSIELLKVLSSIGKVYGVVKGSDKPAFLQDITLLPPLEPYKSFVKKVKKAYRKQNVDVIFADNRKAALSVIYILGFRKPCKILYDMRELRIPSEIKKLTSKLGCFPERYIIKKADLVICASPERTEFVRKEFGVKKCVSFENIRKIEYSNSFRREEMDVKYKSIFANSSFRVISTSGTSTARGNDKLVKATLGFEPPVEVYLVGGGGMEPESVSVIDDIINDNNMSNIHVINMVGQDELKYLIEKCDCGVVNYHSKDTNNKYCASGKVYEFIFEGKPVITTSNPPLMRMTQEYGIGCSGEDYTILLHDMIKNYKRYKENVVRLSESLSVESNHELLAKEIHSILT